MKESLNLKETLTNKRRRRRFMTSAAKLECKLITIACSTVQLVRVVEKFEYVTVAFTSDELTNSIWCKTKVLTVSQGMMQITQEEGRFTGPDTDTFLGRGATTSVDSGVGHGHLGGLGPKETS